MIRHLLHFATPRYVRSARPLSQATAYILNWIVVGTQMELGFAFTPQRSLMRARCTPSRNRAVIKELFARPGT